MKLILAADLHFGSVPEGLGDRLREAVELEEPDLVVIAGDLTLRARHSEFEDAKQWLASLTRPALVLPGNHDLHYWNLLQRFANPLGRYRAALSEKNFMPVVEAAGGFVLGFNTTRSWQPHIRWQEGVARRRDIIAAQNILEAAPDRRFKAVAAHHPFIRVPDRPRTRPVLGAKRALQAFSECGVELLMSGHTHQSFALEIEVEGRRLVAIGAPTALSKRMRGEANGFWAIDAGESAIRCVLWLRNGEAFAPAAEETFNLSNSK